MSEDKSDRFKDYLTFQIQRNVVNLYKSHLSIIEDLRKDHEAMIDKLDGKISKEELEKINYFNEKKYNYIRKKTLDLGNGAIRDFENSVKDLKISL